MLKRLTVHLENVEPIKTPIGKDGKVKTVLYNTITVRNLKSQARINQALTDIRTSHTIAKCTKPTHSRWKIGADMWYTSNETL